MRAESQNRVGGVGVDVEPAPSPSLSDDVVVDDGSVGVYLHLPFCDRICPYCDFAVLAARPLSPDVEARYVADLLHELAARRDDFAGRRLATIYFGGGTPSLFQPESVATLIGALRDAFPSSSASPSSPATGGTEEITLELNPSTTEAARLPGFREAGIDRLSIGVQSFDDEQLKKLGRAHRADRIDSTLAAAREAGFDNVSLDLIFAGPGQNEAALDRDLERLIAFGPEHVSTYELTYEPATPFGRALASGQMEACDEDDAAEMIGQVEARLTIAGYERYEISSYARPGRRARHNARYWQRAPVLGLGMGAHSTEARSAVHPHGARRANPRTLEAWQSALVQDAAQTGEEESFSVEVARGEAVFLALRQREGLQAAVFEKEFGGTPRGFFGNEIDGLLGRGWLAENAVGDLRLSSEGRLLADSVAAEFVADAGEQD
ncbi:MAG: radical SAM family heme chaperone HemW [Myxococcota bacterium]